MHWRDGGTRHKFHQRVETSKRFFPPRNAEFQSPAPFMATPAARGACSLESCDATLTKPPASTVCTPAAHLNVSPTAKGTCAFKLTPAGVMPARNDFARCKIAVLICRKTSLSVWHKQPRLTIHKGKAGNAKWEKERKLHDPRGHCQWHNEKAWCARSACCAWADEVARPVRIALGDHDWLALLFMDNLAGQKREDSKKAITRARSAAHFLPANMTDDLQACPTQPRLMPKTPASILY